MNPTAYSVADRRLSSWADISEEFKREMIRILKVRLKGNKGYDISPIILALALANLSSTESAMGGDQH